MAKYIKTYCSIKDCYGLATIEVANGKDVITNYQPIEKSVADKMDNETDTLPIVNTNLLPCEASGKRIPQSIDKSRGCKVEKGHMRFQCLYCNKLEVPKAPGIFDIYILMDSSGSMETNHKKEGKVIRIPTK